MKYLKTRHRFLKHLIILPFIYPAVIPLLMLDFWIELYHRVSFPIYGIPAVKRSRYVLIDRHRLQYLNVMQKLNCIYCGYANGILQYWVKIIGETEKYWCGIRHGEREGFVSPAHHEKFIPYGDEEAYRREFSSKKTRML
ncbi:MAG: hypothetical protein ACP5D1_10690 [Bacteroidales bacterium]